MERHDSKHCHESRQWYRIVDQKERHQMFHHLVLNPGQDVVVVAVYSTLLVGNAMHLFLLLSKLVFCLCFN